MFWDHLLKHKSHTNIVDKAQADFLVTLMQRPGFVMMAEGDSTEDGKRSQRHAVTACPVPGWVPSFLPSLCSFAYFICVLGNFFFSDGERVQRL